MAIDCLLIETLQQFIKGVPETPRGKNESYLLKEFLKHLEEKMKVILKNF